MLDRNDGVDVETCGYSVLGSVSGKKTNTEGAAMRAFIYVTDQNDSTLLLTCLYSPWKIYNWYVNGVDGPVDDERMGQAYYGPGFYLTIVSPKSTSSPYVCKDRGIYMRLFPFGPAIRAGMDGSGKIYSTDTGFLDTGECEWVIDETRRMGWTSDQLLPVTKR